MPIRFGLFPLVPSCGKHLKVAKLWTAEVTWIAAQRSSNPACFAALLESWVSESVSKWASGWVSESVGEYTRIFAGEDDKMCSFLATFFSNKIVNGAWQVSCKMSCAKSANEVHQHWRQGRFQGWASSNCPGDPFFSAPLNWHIWASNRSLVPAGQSCGFGYIFNEFWPFLQSSKPWVLLKGLCDD